MEGTNSIVFEFPVLRDLFQLLDLAGREVGVLDTSDTLEEVAFFANDLCSSAMIYGDLTHSDFYHDILLVHDGYGPSLNSFYDRFLSEVHGIIRNKDTPYTYAALEDIDILQSPGFAVLTFSNRSK